MTYVQALLGSDHNKEILKALHCWGLWAAKSNMGGDWRKTRNPSVHTRSRFLTHLPLDKMAAISLTTFLDAFSWMKTFVFWLNFHSNLFLRVKLALTQYWFR